MHEPRVRRGGAKVKEKIDNICDSFIQFFILFFFNPYDVYFRVKLL